MTDRDNALARCREIVGVQRTGDAAQLCRRIAKRAAALVAAKSGDDRQARATLDEMGTMTGTQIDAMLEG
jgi:hypothetical protein